MDMKKRIEIEKKEIVRIEKELKDGWEASSADIKKVQKDANEAIKKIQDSWNKQNYDLSAEKERKIGQIALLKEMMGEKPEDKKSLQAKMKEKHKLIDVTEVVLNAGKKTS